PTGEPGRRLARRVTSTAPEISVIVPSYEGRARLVGLLQAMAHQTYQSGRFEVVTVIDGSTDGSADAARGLDVPYDLRVLEREHAGLPAARNRASQHARAPILLYLDDDMIPEPQLVAEHAVAHQSGDDRLVVIGHAA